MPACFIMIVTNAGIGKNQIKNTPQKRSIRKDKTIMQMIDKVKEVIAKQLRIEVSDISDNAAIVEDLGADSLDIVEMLMTLEDEMNIIIPDDATGLKTVKDIATFIENEIA